MVFMIPLSLSLSCKILVGNSVGEAKSMNAKRYYYSTLLIAFIAAVCVRIMFANYRHEIFGSMTK